MALELHELHETEIGVLATIYALSSSEIRMAVAKSLIEIVGHVTNYFKRPIKFYDESKRRGETIFLQYALFNRTKFSRMTQSN